MWALQAKGTANAKSLSPECAGLIIVTRGLEKDEQGEEWQEMNMEQEQAADHIGCGKPW